MYCVCIKYLYSKVFLSINKEIYPVSPFTVFLFFMNANFPIPFN